MTHAHISTWALALILFFVALGLHNAGKEKASKIVHMILRLFYVLIIVTGVMMLMNLGSFPILYILKTLVGLWVIAALEMILVRTKKNKSTKILWIQFIVALLLVLYLGLRLPINWHPFA